MMHNLLKLPAVETDIKAINMNTPRYLQIKQFIQARIASGDWSAGSTVPSESNLMEHFRVSRMTVNRALRELADQGLVDRVKGSGTVVAQLHTISTRLELRDIHEEIIERGHIHSTRVIKVHACKVNASLAQSMKLELGITVFHSILVHSENQVPIQYEDRYVNPKLVPNYLNIDFTQISPTHYLLQHAPITAASYSISACLPTKSQANYLDITSQSPCLTVLRRTESGSNWASAAKLLYPAHRYRFEGQFQA